MDFSTMVGEAFIGEPVCKLAAKVKVVLVGYRPVQSGIFAIVRQFVIDFAVAGRI